MDIIKEILSDGIEAIIFLAVFEVLHNRKDFMKKYKIKTFYFCVLYIFINYFGTFYIGKIYHTLILSILYIFLLKYITKINFFVSCVIYFSFFSIIFVTENLTETIEMIIFNISLNQLFSIQKYTLIFLVISKLFQIFILMIIFKSNKFFDKLSLFNLDNTLISSLILQIGIFGIFIFIINFSTFTIKDTKIYNILIFILYFIFLILEFKELKKYQKFINIKANYKIQEKQIKNMKEIISIIRREKHDFANHINVIWGLCSLNRPNTVEKIKNYVDGISDNLHSSFKYINTGNDYLDGLLSIKNNFADKNNIDLDIMIEEPFSKLKIKENELISIISNLIDNAFEAFQPKSNIQNKKITFDTFIEDNEFYIEISDNAGMIPKNIQNKIFEKGFSTKTEKSDDHGFGLYITKQLIEQNNGCISVESNSEITKFLVAFNLQERGK
ncbi:sensor histidine kinase [Clostridium luticellarii]|jgi:signal transduction histidine kinase|nr:ATP-binding protein [Clostridium luticellarii]MCI1945231.1 ATP-binding protein [Clostridium luticellarii]MCI1969645.1 ATP-binding protein [Clostridium luticellarii]MCI1994564.1 ATP-binding protein [Clostridium luticellarii]MCI2038939.1 ATP-binding protein [Clostridium luticellarii]